MIDAPENPDALLPMQEVGDMPAAAMTALSLGVDVQSILAYARALPTSIDEAQRRYGNRIYRTMLQDGAAASAVRKWKLEVLSDEFRMVPPKGFEKDQAAIDIAAFVERALEEIDTRIEDVAWMMLDSGVDGHSLLEQTWKWGEGKDSEFYTLASLRAIPPDIFTVVTDAYGRFLGVIGRTPGQLPYQWSGPLLIPLSSIPNFVPYWKLCLHTHAPRAGQSAVLGTSRFEGAYNAWRLKARNWGEFLVFLTRWASVMPIGIAGDTETPHDKGVSPSQAIADKLSRLTSGDAIGLPKGSTVQFWTPPAGAAPYLDAKEGLDRDITRAILGSSRAVMEAQHGSKADSGVAQDGVNEDVKFTGKSVCAAIRRQIIRPLVRANWGPNAPVPVLILGADEDTFVANAGAVSGLEKSGYLAPNQRAFLAENRLGMPPAEGEVRGDRASAKPETEEPEGEDGGSI